MNLPFSLRNKRSPRSIRLIGLLVGILAVIGDLFESLVKRSLGLKDLGTLMPGHGGILDRIDAVLFALPVIFLL